MSKNTTTLVIILTVLLGSAGIFFTYTITKNLTTKRPANPPIPPSLMQTENTSSGKSAGLPLASPTKMTFPIKNEEFLETTLTSAAAENASAQATINRIDGTVVDIDGQTVRVRSINQAITSPDQVTERTPAIVTYNVAVTTKTEIVRLASSGTNPTPIKISINDLSGAKRITVFTTTPILPETTNVTAEKIETY